MESESNGGSLPSAEELQAYEKAFPGMGRELLAMAKEEQKHLQAMERTELSLSRRGQIFGLVIALSFLLAATFLVYTHHDTAGTIIGSTDLVALVAVFVIGKRVGADSADRSLEGLIKELQGSKRSAKGIQRRSKTKISPSSKESTPASNQMQTDPTLVAPPVIEPTTHAPAEKPEASDSSPSDVSPPTPPAETPPVRVTARMSDKDRKLWDRFAEHMKLPKETDE